MPTNASHYTHIKILLAESTRNTHQPEDLAPKITHVFVARSRYRTAHCSKPPLHNGVKHVNVCRGCHHSDCAGKKRSQGDRIRIGSCAGHEWKVDGVIIVPNGKGKCRVILSEPYKHAKASYFSLSVVPVPQFFAFPLMCSSCSCTMFFLGSTPPLALLASLQVCVLSCVKICFLAFLVFVFSRFRFLFSSSSRTFLASMVGSRLFLLGVVCTTYHMYVSDMIRASADLAFYYLSEVYYFLFYFFPEAFFQSRVIGACPVTTDLILATNSCENNNNVLGSPRAESPMTSPRVLCPNLLVSRSRLVA